MFTDEHDFNCVEVSTLGQWTPNLAGQFNPLVSSVF